MPSDPSSLERYRSIVPEWSRFVETVRRPEPTYLRIRTGRASPGEVVERLGRHGFRLESLGTPSDVFRVLEEPVSAGNTLEHWLGLFYVQQAVTALAAPALDPRPGERVLDMAAAPGGKSTHIADLMDDRGTLVASDVSDKRIRGLLGNLYRTCHPGVLVVCGDGRNLGGEGLFDRVLLDAPCSGEGNLRKRGGKLPAHSAGYLEYIGGLQRKLLRRGLDHLRPGGTLLYVTCTFNPAENEAVVSDVLHERAGEVTVEPIDLAAPHAPGVTSFEGAAFHPDVERAWRLYPHHFDSGGLFMCRLRRHGSEDEVAGGWEEVPASFPGDPIEGAGERAERCVEQLADLYGVPRAAVEGVRWMARGDSVWGTTADRWPPAVWREGSDVRVISLGLRGFKDDPRAGAGLRPTNDLLQWLGDHATRRVVTPTSDEWSDLLSRETIDARGLEDGFVVLRLGDRTVGRGLALGGRVRHEIPKARARRLLDVLELEEG